MKFFSSKSVKGFRKRFGSMKKGVIILIFLSVLSTFFVLAQVQASRSTTANVLGEKIQRKLSSTATPIPTKIATTPSITPKVTITITVTPQLTNAISPTPTAGIIIPTSTLTPTKIPNRITRNTPTPMRKPSIIPTVVLPTFTPTPTFVPTATPQLSTDTPFSFLLSPQGSFTPQARGEGSGIYTKPSGFWSFTFSASFTKLVPNRVYQLWFCGINCSSHTALQFITNNEGNGGFSSATITHNQAKDPLNRIVVWEASVPGIIHEDEHSCVMQSMNSTPCLQTAYYLQ